VLTDQGSSVLVFSSSSTIREFLRRRNAELSEEETVYNFVALEIAEEYQGFDFEDCDEILGLYNFLQDIANSLGIEILRCEAIDSAYKKLFFGANLPSATPPGAEQFPVMTETERATLFLELKRLLDAFLTRRTHVN
jgi:hypothetical protein